MRRLIISALVSLTLASPAHAALDADEKASIQQLTGAVERLVLAWGNFANATQYTTTANRPAMTNLWAGLITPTTNLTDAYAMLLHVNTAAPGDTAAYNAFEGTARATLVADAKAKLTTTDANLTTAFNLAEAARTVPGQDGTYVTLLGSVKTEITAAQTRLAAFNTGFSYTAPRGTPWFPRVVTPHGNFLASTRLLHAATVRMIASMDLFRQVYNAAGQGETALPADSTTNLAFVRLVFASSELILKFTRVLHTWVDIPTPGMCQFSPHHTMMRIMEALTQFGSESASLTTPFRGGEFAGAPYRFHMASTFNDDFLERLRASMETRPLTWVKLNAGLAKYFESWQAQDGAMWEIMNFPAGVTLSSLRVQAGRTNASHTPPLCPDATNPTSTLVYPANGQTVRGRITAVAECRDTIDDAAWGVGEKGTLCAKVEFKIDGVTVASVSIPPYEYQWDTTLMSNASHTVQAIGFDAANNPGATSIATVTVGN